jgi:hypothetical protein
LRSGKIPVHFLSTPEGQNALFSRIDAERARNLRMYLTGAVSGNCKEMLEARGGIGPPNKGFADLSLTTWVPRLFGFMFTLEP